MSILCDEMDSNICDGYQELITLIVKMEILLCSIFMALATHCLRIWWFLNSHPSTHIMFERIMLPLVKWGTLNCVFLHSNSRSPSRFVLWKWRKSPVSHWWKYSALTVGLRCIRPQCALCASFLCCVVLALKLEGSPYSLQFIVWLMLDSVNCLTLVYWLGCGLDRSGFHSSERQEIFLFS